MKKLALLTTILLPLSSVASAQDEVEAVTQVGEQAIESIGNMADNVLGIFGDGWSGQVDGGFSLSQGNTEKTDLNLGALLNKESGKWGHTLKGKAFNSVQDDARSAERYNINAQTRYSLSDMDYAFGEIDWDKDRYSGYDYRLTEVIGYGRHWVKEDDLKVLTEIGIGARQNKDDAGDKSEEFIGKGRLFVDWAIREGLVLTEDLSVTGGEEGVVTLSDTALRVALTESMAIKLGHNIKHQSEVPANTEKLDQVTTVGVLYKF